MDIFPSRSCPLHLISQLYRMPLPLSHQNESHAPASPFHCYFHLPPPFPFLHHVTLRYDPSNEFIPLCANSTPKNVAALAGTARAIAGPNPGKKARSPPLLHTPFTVPAMVGRPSADCSRDLIVSTGKTGIHMATPAAPPATSTAGRLSWPVAFPSASLGVRLRLTYS